MMYSKLDINRNIKTTDTHARDMHMGFFFFFKSSFTQYNEVTKPWSAAPAVYSGHHLRLQRDSQEIGADCTPEKAT